MAKSRKVLWKMDLAAYFRQVSFYEKVEIDSEKRGMGLKLECCSGMELSSRTPVSTTSGLSSFLNLG